MLITLTFHIELYVRFITKEPTLTPTELWVQNEALTNLFLKCVRVRARARVNNTVHSSVTQLKIYIIIYLNKSFHLYFSLFIRTIVHTQVPIV